MHDHRSELADDTPTITLYRTYDAPQSLVWRGITDPDLLKNWWGPDGFTIEPISHDFRAGGHWHFIMIGPDGTRYVNYHLFTKIEPEQLLAYHNGEFENDPNGFDAEISLTALSRETTELRLHMIMSSFEARQTVLDFGALEAGQQTLAHLTPILEQLKAEK
ncbi:MAG: SRPBCC domain-containing protein [Hyphomicrobiaceae bacterium]|nr:SRPBCC domain-containing protein [Hyphomicrobiaceae bacterium]MCC0023664.1 SRPBCC domain-containing protein [Hyphomicrobiaceae bacterium]